jgi:hypothetical protein
MAMKVANVAGVEVDTRHWSFDFYADLKNTVYAPQGWRAMNDSRG